MSTQSIALENAWKNWNRSKGKTWMLPRSASRPRSQRRLFEKAFRRLLHQVRQGSARVVVLAHQSMEGALFGLILAVTLSSLWLLAG